MSLAMPLVCANPLCGDVAFKPIHCATQKVAIDAVEGPPVYSHHVTYRCSSCGHTWATQGYSSERVAVPEAGTAFVVDSPRFTSRGW
jgi:hypothetical protein